MESELTVSRVEDYSAQSMAVAVPLKCSQQEFTLSDKLKFSNSLTIICHNIRGLRDKIEELICSQKSNNINCYICFSEHAAEQNLLTLKLENYYLASNFSFIKYIGGGSCIFVRSHLGLTHFTFHILV